MRCGLDIHCLLYTSRCVYETDVKEFAFRDAVTGKRVPITKGVLLAIYLTDRQKTLPYKISEQAKITAINERNKYYSEKYKDTPKTYEGYMKHAQYVSLSLIHI